MKTDNADNTLIALNGRFDRLMDNIDQVKEKQDEMADDISKIKEALFDPDQGLYARLRELESWKASSSRLIWIIISAIVIWIGAGCHTARIKSLDLDMGGLEIEYWEPSEVPVPDGYPRLMKRNRR